MASTYPLVLDVFAPTPSTLAGPMAHSLLHKQATDALAAIEATLGTNPQGADATVAAAMAALPTRYALIQQKEAAYVEGLSSPATFGGGGAVDLATMSVTFVAVAGRKYRFDALACFTQNTAAGIVNLILADGSNNVIQQSNQSAGIGAFLTIPIVKRLTGLSGSYTCKLRAATSGGTLSQAPGVPFVLMVTDVGT